MLSMSPLVERFLGSALRFALGPLFGWLAAKGVIPVEDSREYLVELTGWIIGILWELYVKYGDRLTFLAAKKLPADASGASIQARAKAPDIKKMAFKSNTDN